jgi:hypothetical protein
VPTVTFSPNPAWGPPSIITQPNPSVLSESSIAVVFWGDYWQTSPLGPSEQRDVTNAIQTLFPNRFGAGGFLRVETDYGSNGVAYANSFQNIGTSFLDNQFHNADLISELENNFNPVTAGPSPLIVFVTPPGVSDPDFSDAGGFHEWDDTLNSAYAWVSTPQLKTASDWSKPLGALDFVTTALSHEVAEAVSDAIPGNGSNEIPATEFAGALPGLTENPGEISDNEAEIYKARINGLETQAYWSVEQGLYVVPDGTSDPISSSNPNAQVLALAPRWQGTKYRGNVLTINGDQLADTNDDTIRISMYAPNRVQVTLNGYTEYFDPNEISSIVINPGAGFNTINIDSTSVPVRINNSGTDTVTIGDGTVQNILAEVDILPLGGTTTLTVDDHLDTAGLTSSLVPSSSSEKAGVGYEALTGLTGGSNVGGDIVYDGNYVAPKFELGSGTFSVDTTGSLYTTISAASFVTVGLNGTGGPVEVDGAANALVTVGTNYPETVANIQGSVFVHSIDGIVYLSVNDAQDNGLHAATLDRVQTPWGTTYMSLTGLSPGGSIGYDLLGVQPSFNLGANTNLNVNTTGDDTTIFQLTQGTDNVNLYATEAPVQVSGTGGSVYIGDNGTLTGIRLPIYVDGSVSLTVDDFRDLSSPTITLGDGRDPTGRMTNRYQELDIDWSDPNIASVAVTYAATSDVNLWFGSGAFTANDTGTANTWINLNAAIASLLGTRGVVTVHTSASTTLQVGGNNLQNITGIVKVDSTDNTGQVIVNDTYDTTAHPAAVLGPVYSFLHQLFGWAQLTGVAGVIEYEGDEVTPTINLGANTTLSVRALNTGSLPTIVNTNGTGDEIDVQSTSGGFTITSGDNTADTVVVGAGQNSLDTIGSTFTLSGNGQDTLKVEDAQGNGGFNPPAGATNVRTSLTYYLDGQQVNRLAGESYQTAQGFSSAFGEVFIDYSGVSSMELDGSNLGANYNLAGTSAPTSVVGGSGNDKFAMNAGGGSLNGALTLDGGGGRNALDYTNYQGNVLVDLRTGTANGFAGGVKNIQDVIGGPDTNILVGNGGNTLTGGAGRNLLIAGPTASTLTGNSDEDILVGGTTDYDMNAGALTAIMAEWSRTDLTYAQRVQDLLNGQDGFTVLGALNFHTNGGGNTMDGGPGLDLFYGLLPGDQGTPDTTDWAPQQGEIFVDPSGIKTRIQIDVSHLSNPYVFLDNATRLDTTGAPFVTLAPGTHTISTYTGGSITFQVSVAGIVSYDAGLEGILTGQNTRELTVQSAAISIDIRWLTDPYLYLDNYKNMPAGAVFQAFLLPGSHAIREYQGGEVGFEVTPQGTVQYDKTLEGILTGQGTRGLNVNGSAIAINAQALIDPSLYFDSYVPMPRGSDFPTHLLPGTHQIQEIGGGHVNFKVSNTGQLEYVATLEGILTGSGTQRLTVNGAAITIDAHFLSDPYLYFDSFVPMAQGSLFAPHLLPGTHTIQEIGGGKVSFMVNNSSQVQYDATLEGILKGANTSQLIVRGAAITIDARALSAPGLYIDSYLVEPNSMLFTVNLLPGQHTVRRFGGTQYAYFTVTPDGKISFDSSEDNILGGAATTTLVILALN